jgi:hypothetical protein
MDAGGHLRAWEDNHSATHRLTSYLPNPSQRNQTAVTPIGQASVSTRLLPQDRTLPSLSSVFESNSIRSTPNSHSQSQDPSSSHSSEIKASSIPEHGLKRPRLSHDQGRRSEADIIGDSTQVVISVGSFRDGVIIANYSLIAIIFML